MSQADELYKFSDETGAQDNGLQGKEETWPILIVDDEPDVHHVTEFALQQTVVFGKKLEFLHAYTGEEGIEIFKSRQDICIILLDVIMEEADSGLRMAQRIREELNNHKTRIILRTGQPGQVPEVDTITKYDINDYKTKSELTRARLLTTIISSLRSWQQINKIDSGKKGLEKIIHASNKLMETKGLSDFAEGVIQQLAAFFSLKPEGLLCVEDCGKKGNGYSGCKIVAASGHFRELLDKKTSEINDSEIINEIRESFKEGKNILRKNSFTLFFSDPENSKKFVSWIGSEEPIQEVDKDLLEIFCKNIALCAKNIDLIDLLKRQAWEDSLLHLPNLAALTNKLSDSEDISLNCPCVIAFVDINHFSQINDYFGHDYGDKLLKAMKEYLKKILDPEVFISRISADVFALVGKKNILEKNVFERILEASLETGEGLHQITCSIGYYTFIKDRVLAMEGLKNAALALKRAKTEGLGKLVQYNESIGDEIRTRNELLAGLRSDFKAEKLFLVYQPQFRISDKGLLGFEALLRWKKDDGKFISPDIFIPLAEQGGLISDLGLWVIKEALKASKKLTEMGFPEYKMAVNVSAAQLGSPDFLKSFNDVLKESEIKPSALELEITESISAIGIEGVLSLLKTIKKMGIGLAIDDFGTGYSSLSSIQEWPMDRLKIDRAFILNMESNKKNIKIIEMLIPFAKKLQFKTLAEGVETEDQLKALEEMGCEEVQGYLLGKPMAFDILRDWLKNREV